MASIHLSPHSRAYPGVPCGPPRSEPRAQDSAAAREPDARPGEAAPERSQTDRIRTKYRSSAKDTAAVMRLATFDGLSTEYATLQYN